MIPYFKKILISALALAAVLIGPMASVSSAEQDDAGNLAIQWAAAFNSKNSKTIAQLYAPEAVLIPPNGKRLRSEGIEEYWQRILGSDIGDVSLDKLDSHVDGSLAYQTGVFRLALGTGTSASGHVLSVYCKKPAGWKICAQMWSNEP